MLPRTRDLDAQQACYFLAKCVSALGCVSGRPHQAAYGQRASVLADNQFNARLMIEAQFGRGSLSRDRTAST
jgi:hypothetical protein